MILVLLVMSVTALAQNGRQLYNKYSDAPGMEAVYISPAMFRMIGKIPDMEFGDGEVNISSIIKSMTGFYVLSTEDPVVGKALYDEVQDYVTRGTFELLMESKDSGSVTRIFTAGDDFTITSFVMLSSDRNEVSYISFDGRIDRADMENILADTMK